MKKNQQELDMIDQNTLISLIKAKLEMLQKLSSINPDLFKEEMHHFFLEYPIKSDRDRVIQKIASQQWDVDLLALLIYKEIEDSLDDVSNNSEYYI